MVFQQAETCQHQEPSACGEPCGAFVKDDRELSIPVTRPHADRSAGPLARPGEELFREGLAPWTHEAAKFFTSRLSERGVWSRRKHVSS